MIFFRIVSNLIFLFLYRFTTLLKNVSMEISLLPLECIREGELMAEEISYRRFTTKSLVFFKRIICRPQESPRSNSGIMMPCCFFPPAALSLSLYDVLIINSYHQDSSQQRCGLDVTFFVLEPISPR